MPALISGFCSIKQQGVFIHPPGWDTTVVHCRLPPSINFCQVVPKQFAGSHLYTWVERGTMRVLPKNTTWVHQLFFACNIISFSILNT